MAITADELMRRYRPPIPVHVKIDVVIRQRGLCGATKCGQPLQSYQGTQFDHCPALALRDYNDLTRSYNPPANDPDRIIAKHTDCHAIKTSGTPATSAGSDKHAIAKAYRLATARGIVNNPDGSITETRPKPRSRWASRRPARAPSWYCDRCQAEVYSARCRHCGKSEGERA